MQIPLLHVTKQLQPVFGLPFAKQKAALTNTHSARATSLQGKRQVSSLANVLVLPPFLPEARTYVFRFPSYHWYASIDLPPLVQVSTELASHISTRLGYYMICTTK